MLFNIAQLDVDALESVQSLEQEMGKALIAFKGFDATPADVSAAELAQIQDLEGKLGVALVAVET